jgi:hypothetical protein
VTQDTKVSSGARVKMNEAVSLALAPFTFHIGFSGRESKQAFLTTMLREAERR